MNQQLVQKPKFSVAIQSKGYQNLINQTLGDPERAKRFVAAISSAVAVNPELQACDAATILSGGLLGESLNLSPSPQLGQYYLVPFNDRKNNRKVAQFILGYKGYKQLAIRSGKIKKMNVIPVKEGELVSRDRFNDVYEFKGIEDDEVREKTPTIGYYAFVDVIGDHDNVYRKELYWSKKEMEAHALQYSKGYAAKKGYTFWEKNFDSMACKTMIRQLLGKGDIPMSTDMERGYKCDNRVVHEDMSAELVEESEPILPEAQDEPENNSNADGIIPEGEGGEISLDDI